MGFHYGCLLRNCDTESDCELYQANISQNYISESYYEIVIRKYITELYICFGDDVTETAPLGILQAPGTSRGPARNPGTLGTPPGPPGEPPGMTHRAPWGNAVDPPGHEGTPQGPRGTAG